MSKFIKLLLFFSAPIIIGLLSFETVLRNIPNDYSFKKEHLDANANNIEVLFLGNSHIFYGINPEYLHYKSFNQAHISQSLNFDLAILEKYQNKWEKLKCIVIPIDYFSMYSTLAGGIEKWRIKNYSIYYDISLDRTYNLDFELLNGKLPNHISRVKGYLLNNETDIRCNKFGFGTSYNSKQNRNLIESGEIAAERHSVDLKKNRNTFLKNIDTVNKLIDFAHKRKLKVIFVTCPAYSTYRKNLNSVQLQKTISTIKRLCSNQKNTFYFNLLNDKDFVATDFYDADHFNEIGAKKFTLKLASLISKVGCFNSTKNVE